MTNKSCLLIKKILVVFEDFSILVALSNIYKTFTDLDHTLGPKSVKVSRRLLNVYVQSDAFSIEVIFKN